MEGSIWRNLRKLIFNMPQYNVTITRTGYSVFNRTVEAGTVKEAETKVTNMAADSEMCEYDARYEVEAIQEVT